MARRGDYRECHSPARIFPRALLLGMGVAAVIEVAVAVLSSMLLAVGAALWVINRLVVGKVDVDPTRLAKG